MIKTYSLVMPASRELCSIDEDCLIEDGRLELLGRKPWSTGEGGGIIESNQETITVRWVPDTH